MKILLITGSPREGGASSVLAGAFEKGALSAGHEVFRFDAGLKKVAPCSVCEYCHTDGDRCIIRDDMDELVPHLLESDALVHRLRWRDAGVIAARGIVTADEMRKSEFPRLAEDLGRSIGTL